MSEEKPEMYSRYPEAEEARTPDPSTQAVKVGEEVPKPKTFSKEDRLELEVEQIKLQNVQLQLQIMQGDLAKALSARDQIVNRMKKKREEMLEKYGVDISQVHINDDGTYQPIQRPGQ